MPHYGTQHPNPPLRGCNLGTIGAIAAAKAPVTRGPPAKTITVLPPEEDVMSTTDSGPGFADLITPQRTARTAMDAGPDDAPRPEPTAPDPAILGLPAFSVGAIALGLSLTTFLPATAAAGILPIIMLATGLGLIIATLWAANLGQSILAGIFGSFAGFWLSYAALTLGLTHNWYGIQPADVKETVGTFLLCWALAAAVLTVATLRLPSAYTLLLALVTLALAIDAWAVYDASTTLAKLAGYVVLAFAASGVYLFMSATQVALGGPSYPLGRPVIR